MKTARFLALAFMLIELFYPMGCARNQSIGRSASHQPPEAADAQEDATALTEPRYTYHEFDMIFVFYKTNELNTYQQLLPSQFQMPADPLVMVFFADYYKMDKATQPYQEAAVFLLVEYGGKPAWHCVTMPVTSNEARLGGIYYLGYPKIMGDITLQRAADQFKGTLKLKNKKVMSVLLNTKDHQVSPEEKRIFERLKGLPSLTIKDGEVFQPRFGKPSGQYTLLQLSQMYPDKLEVAVGQSDLFVDAGAAAEYSTHLGAIFSMPPAESVLAYYLKNKFVMRFNN